MNRRTETCRRSPRADSMRMMKSGLVRRGRNTRRGFRRSGFAKARAILSVRRLNAKNSSYTFLNRVSDGAQFPEALHVSWFFYLVERDPFVSFSPHLYQHIRRRTTRCTRNWRLAFQLANSLLDLIVVKLFRIFRFH